MLNLCTILLCILLVSASPVEKEAEKEPGGRIYNGFQASLGQFPWQAGIYYWINGTVFFKSGAIITPQWVLTEALRPGVIQSAVVYTGQVKLTGDVGFISAGVEFLNHKASSTTVTLIKLGAPLQFNDNVNAIAIGEGSLDVGDVVVVSGWGGNDHDLTTSVALNYAYQTVIRNTECATIHGKFVTSDMVCANSSTTQSLSGPCRGDYGDPLVLNYHKTPALVGILHAVPNDDCQKGSPSIYITVADHSDWIREQTGISLISF